MMFRILVILGRVKNPKFMEQVSAAFGKEEKLVVVNQTEFVTFLIIDRYYSTTCPLRP